MLPLFTPKTLNFSNFSTKMYLIFSNRTQKCLCGFFGQKPLSNVNKRSFLKKSSPSLTSYVVCLWFQYVIAKILAKAFGNYAYKFYYNGGLLFVFTIKKFSLFGVASRRGHQASKQLPIRAALNTSSKMSLNRSWR